MVESTHTQDAPQRNNLEIQRVNTKDKQRGPELAGGLHDEKGWRIKERTEIEREKGELETT